MTSFDLSDIKNAGVSESDGGASGSRRGSDVGDSSEQMKILFQMWLEAQKKKDDPREATAATAVPEEDAVWRSKCCNSEDGTEISRSCLTYSLTSIISIVVLVFSLYQLGSDEEEDSLTPLWISLVSSIGSLHVPSPLQYGKK